MKREIHKDKTETMTIMQVIQNQTDEREENSPKKRTQTVEKDED